jgi:DNA-binding transcriptional MerR regulator
MSDAPPSRDGSKSSEAYRTISEVSDEIRVPQHVLRFWETKFPAIKPLKRGGNRRYYRPEDVALISAVNKLLYTDGYTIRGVQKLLKDRGVKAVVSGEKPAEAPAATPPEMPLPLTEAPKLGAAEIAALRSIRDRLASAISAARA